MKYKSSLNENEIISLEIGGKIRNFYIGNVEVHYAIEERDHLTSELHRIGEKYTVTLVEIYKV